jgi:hypothetical protein
MVGSIGMSMKKNRPRANPGKGNNNNNNNNASGGYGSTATAASAATGTTLSFPSVARILRTVPEENAFYFYKMNDYYLDTRAVSLDEFLDRVRTVDAASLEFHLARDDFKNWFTFLGDSALASEVSELKGSGLRGEELRARISKLVESRLTGLRSYER